MRIVIAPDKFKGSLSADEVSAHLAAGLLSELAHASVISAPMADGGEGTVDAAIAAGFTRVTCTVTGPLGAPVQASFALHEHAGTEPTEAVIELAAASGLLLVKASSLRPLTAHTRGTGELIAAALNAGARRIVIAVGGSASTDGGTGMLTALGARFLDVNGDPLPLGGGALEQLRTIDLAGLDPRLKGTEVVLAADVDHLLTGPHGAARVFAPQKGAGPGDVEALERGLKRLAEVTKLALPNDPDHALSPGAGAAGGVGFAAMAMLGARQRAGAEVVAEVTGLARLVRGADLVITGEGSFDAQSLGGKTPVGVLRVAQTAGVPTVLVCGRAGLTGLELREAGFVASYAIADRDADPRSCMVNAARHLEQIGRDIGRMLQDA